MGCFSQPGCQENSGAQESTVHMVQSWKILLVRADVRLPYIVSGHPQVQSSPSARFSSPMDPAQQQEMNEQLRGTNCKLNHLYMRSDSGKLLGTSSPPRVPPVAQYPNILPIPLIYETRMSPKCLIYLGAANFDFYGRGRRGRHSKWCSPCRSSLGWISSAM